MRQLVVNADDFGLSPAVNLGIVKAHDEGIVTSTSLMVRQPAAEAAAAAARTRPALSIGLHVDVAEWEEHGGAWRTRYRWVDPDDSGAVAREVDEQLRRFEHLVGRQPTHLDSHQHLHRDEPLRSILLSIAARHRIPLRHHSPAVYCGAFYGQGRAGRPFLQAICPQTLAALIRALSDPVTELCCHPAVAGVPSSAYNVERLVELCTLCDPLVLAAVAESGIQLVGFAELRPT